MLRVFNTKRWSIKYAEISEEERIFNEYDARRKENARKKHNQFKPEEVQEHVYHAQPHISPGTLNPRTPKNYNSIGTWFTSNEEAANYLYGKNVTKYPVPQGKILEQEDFASSFMDLDLIQKHFGQKVAEHLRRYPWTPQNQQRKRELHRRIEREDQLYTKWLSLPESKEYKFLQKSEKMYRDAILNTGYISDLRQKLISQGVNGFVWRNSNIDSPKQPHDVYVIFNDRDIEPA